MPCTFTDVSHIVQNCCCPRYQCSSHHFTSSLGRPPQQVPGAQNATWLMGSCNQFKVGTCNLRFGKVYPGGRLKQTEMLLISEIDRRSSSLNQERKRSWNSSACTTIQQSQRISSRSTGGLAASTKCHTLCLYSVQPRVFIHTWEPPWDHKRIAAKRGDSKLSPHLIPMLWNPTNLCCPQSSWVSSPSPSDQPKLHEWHHTLVASTPSSAKLPGESFPCSPGLHVGIGRGPELEKSPSPEPSSSWSTRSPGSQSRCASLMLSTLETCPHWRCYVGG